MVSGRRCAGCSASRRVDMRTGLCTDCAGLAMEIVDRQEKLRKTVQSIFAKKIRCVALKLKEFNSIRKVKP